MPLRGYIRRLPADSNGVQVIDAFVDEQWSNSPKVGRKLILQSNPCVMQKYFLEGQEILRGPNGFVSVSGLLQSHSSVNWGPTDNQALARFNGKLRKGSASLGVTLASWKQSRSMIVDRLSKVGNLVDSATDRLRRDPRGRRRLQRQKEPLANQVLETEFGWRPLASDLEACLTTVCQDGIPSYFVTARGSSVWDDGFRSSSSGVITTSRLFGPIRTTYSARVRVSNPNLWLLNRLGLINPATVIWDLVPWSFVVNMFVNVNAMISSVTDEVGLSVDSRSITRGSHLRNQITLDYRNSGYGLNRTTYHEHFRQRVNNVGLQPTWQVKVPDLNWELALIASSLLVQKAQRLNRLISVL